MLTASSVNNLFSCVPSSLSATGRFRSGVWTRMSPVKGSIIPGSDPGRNKSDANQWANAIGWDVLTRADTAAGRGVPPGADTAGGGAISTGAERALTGADPAACGALSAGLGKPAPRLGATVKRDGITTTAKQASNATVASMSPGDL